MAKLYDALIIGAGPAGLAAALALSRALRSCTVFERQVYRNDYAHRMHTVPGHDHIEPKVYRQRARDELVGGHYNTVNLADVGAKSLEKLPNGDFQIVDDNGKVWSGKAVIFATGSRDIMPPLKGYKEAWGRSIWQCLFCDGYEQRNAEDAGVLLTRPLGPMPIEIHISQAMMARRFAKNVTIFTDGDEEILEHDAAKKLMRNGIIFDTRRIVELRYIESLGQDATHLDVVFEDNTTKRVKFLVHKPPTESANELAASIGLTTNATGDYPTTGPFGQTSIDRVFVAGDAMTSMKAVVPAQSSGIMAGVGVHHTLLEKEMAP